MPGSPLYLQLVQPSSALREGFTCAKHGTVHTNICSCYQAKLRNTRTHLPLDEYRECRGALEELSFEDNLACWSQVCGAAQLA